jgi:3-methyladenine DNA glycosylase/8-oxoguanine DNA glycosylase
VAFVASPSTTSSEYRQPILETATVRLAVKRPFGLYPTVICHGWYQTKPFQWDEERRVLRRAESLRDGRVMLLEMAEAPSERRGYRDVVVSVTGVGASDAGVPAEMARRVRLMLRLDEDLRGFYALARTRPELDAARRTGAGRLMRSSSLWEDIVKTILGTNVVWRQAVVMINRLAELGDVCPALPELRAWPTPGQVTRAGERYLRDTVRAGYRSPYIVELAKRMKSGDIDLEAIEAQVPSMDLDTLYRTLTGIKGIGRSSAHYLMNLLGRYDHISIDSATISYAKRELFRGKTPTEKQIRRKFAQFGRWQSLVYWFARWTPKAAWWEDASGRSSA